MTRIRHQTSFTASSHLWTGHDLPLAIGVIRDVEAPVYNEEVSAQVAQISSSKGFGSLRDMIMAGEAWIVK